MLDSPLWLAPLAGVTNPPLREFYSRLGAALTHTEMVSCAGIVRGNRKTEDMLKILSEENPVVLQLFGGETDVVIKGAEAALEFAIRQGRNFSALGLNMACPMPKVTKRGAGAALLRRIDVAFDMTYGLKKLGLPVWVKMRRISDEYDETFEFIDSQIKAGADNICIHGRTSAQRYEGIADRRIVAEAARRFTGMISASGDVKTVDDIKEYLSFGCVGVMLARGALTNPWLFPEALLALGYSVKEDFINPPAVLRLARLVELGERAREVSCERQAVLTLKRLMTGMLRGLNGAAELRRRAGCAVSLAELFNVFQEIG